MIQRNRSEADELEQRDAIDRGTQLEAFFKHIAYGYVLDWLEARTDKALAEIRASHMSSDDRLKVNLQMRWAVLEDTAREFELMVQDAIYEKDRVLEAMKETNVESS